MGDHKSKKEQRAKAPMAVTKAGRKSNAVKQPKAKAVVVDTLSIADAKDMRKFMGASVDEKALPTSIVHELEMMFLFGAK